MTSWSYEEHYRVELFKDSDGMAKTLVDKVPFDTNHSTPPDVVIRFEEEAEIRLPAYFESIEDAEALCEKIGPLPDATCLLITNGEWGPGVTPDELDEMDVEEAMELCEWDAYQVVRVYVSES